MKNLRAIPNPFQHLDHEGVPASAFPFDPSHSPDRRWVGATVDRSPGADGLPRTRRLDTEGDLTAILPKTIRGRAVFGQRGGTLVNVDRSPRKRVQFAFDVGTPVALPAKSTHYLLGFRQRSLIPADEATAKAVGLPFVDPKTVLRDTAAHTVAVWKREHGEEPDFALWPANLREAAGRAPEAAKEEPPAEKPVEPPATADGAKEGHAPADEPPVAEVEKKDAAPVAGGGVS